MRNPDVIRALRGVPETRLRLIELTWQVVDDRGAIDPDKVRLHYKEINEAVDEAQAYSQETERAVLWLRQLALSLD